MDLHLLVGDGARPQDSDGFFKLGDREVGDPDLPGQALCLGLGQLLQIDRHRHLILGGGPVNKRQIQIVGAQFLQAQLQARDHLARAELADPHLGGQVDILAGNTAFAHQLAHFGLVVIDLGGIYMAIAEIQTLQQGVAQGLIFQAKGTKTQVGHLHHHIPQVIVSTLNIVSAHPRIQGGQGTGRSWIQAS
ncbi:hypothetical protein D3C80_1482580 [compost metagenome]